MALDQTGTGERLDLLIPSIRCAGCMRKVETALGDTAGVLHARVNLTAHSACILYDPIQTDAEHLIQKLGAVGYSARPVDLEDAQQQEARIGRALLMKTGVAGFAAMNVMLLSIGVWSGADGAMRDLLHWVSAMIALPAMAYAGTPFFVSALGALKARRLNMDVPISLALILSAGSSLFETSQGGQHAFFDAGIMLVFFLLIGRVLEHQTRIRARSAAAELMAMTGRFATQLTAGGATRQVAVADLVPGMRLAIAPGDTIPADGTILEGKTDLNRALITGESQPVPVNPADHVHAGETNLSGALQVEVTRASDDSLLAEIANLVSAAQAGKGRYDRMADRAASLYAPVVHILAALALCGWLVATGDARLSVQIAVAVLIITCPCALALAVPTVHTVATSRLFRAGIFLKDGAALERLAEVDTIVFDKTGTLTDGKPTLTDAPAPDDPAWSFAAALAGASKHPFSQAIKARADALGIEPVALKDRTEHPGMGVSAQSPSGTARLGRPEWICPAGQHKPGVFLELPDGQIHRFSFSEALRPGTADVCDALRAKGYDLHILSGDAAASVARVAAQTGISQTAANLTPVQKHAALDQMAQQGRRTLMIGDGLNDNPALAAAHASMSPSSAMDATQTVADLVFTGQSLDAVVSALDLAKSARQRSIESFGIAAVYNAIAIPLAFAGYVVPLIAALAMSGSSIAVILNAIRLRTNT